MNDHHAIEVRHFEHPGAGRKRAKPTPKGRQVDPKALAEVEALLGDRPLRRDLLIEHLHLIQDRYHQISAAHLAALADAHEALLRRGVRDGDFLRAFRHREGGRARSSAAYGPRLRQPHLRAFRARRSCSPSCKARWGRRCASCARLASGSAIRRPPSRSGIISCIRPTADAVEAAVKAKDTHPHVPTDYVGYDAYVAEGRLRALAALARRRDGERDAPQGARRWRLARARRRGLSHGAQMALGDRRARSAPHGRECGRGRARHLQGSRLSRQRSASLPRRHADRRPCGRGGGDLHLSSRRISDLARNPHSRDREVAAGRPPHPSAARRRRLYLRGGILAPRKRRRQAWPAAPQAALPFPGRALRPADAHQQCRDALLGARHRGKRRRAGGRATDAMGASGCAASRCRAASRIPA